MEKIGHVTSFNRRGLMLGAVAVAGSGGAWWWLYRYTPPHEGGLLTVQQAYAKASTGDILLLDIRTPTEWRRTGVPEGAVPLDMRRADFTEALTMLMQGDNTRPVALICAGGVRSARLSKRLIAAGFTTIMDVPEGMYGSAAGPGWLNSNLPVRAWNG